MQGQFEIEFRVDGLNHFVCPTYPAHSHWSYDETTNTVDINWGKYGMTVYCIILLFLACYCIHISFIGEYVLVCDPASRSMTGHGKGDPGKWRKASFIRSLPTSSITDVPSHDHSHVHDENCKH